MASETGADSQQSSAPGTHENFHLGLAADGTTCALVFVDERRRSIAYIARFADLNGFMLGADDGYIVGSLIDDGGQVVPIRMRPEVANEMTRNMLKTAQVASAC